MFESFTLSVILSPLLGVATGLVFAGLIYLAHKGFKKLIKKLVEVERRRIHEYRLAEVARKHSRHRDFRNHLARKLAEVRAGLELGRRYYRRDGIIVTIEAVVNDGNTEFPFMSSAGRSYRKNGTYSNQDSPLDLMAIVED